MGKAGSYREVRRGLVWTARKSRLHQAFTISKTPGAFQQPGSGESAAFSGE